MSVRVNDPGSRVLNFKPLQDRYQLTARQLSVHVVGGETYQADALYCCRDESAAVIAGPAATNLHGSNRVRIGKAPRHIQQGEAIVRTQIIRLFRLAVPRKVLGTPTDQNAARRDLACDQRAIGESAHTHCQIEALGDDIDQSHACVEIYGYVGILCRELGQRWRQIALSIEPGGRDSHQAFRALLKVRHVRFQRLELVEDCAAALVINAAHFGEPYRSRRPV